MATYTRLVRVAMRLRSYEARIRGSYRARTWARIRGSYPARTWARIRGEGVVRHNSAKMKNTIKIEAGTIEDCTLTRPSLTSLLEWNLVTLGDEAP